ncbi:MAG: YggU family protein [Nitrospirales bacterium]|nr:YggU family protein [Nitrospirales bacterium]
MEIPHKKVKDGIIIEIKVDPRSSRKEIVGVMEHVLKVKLTAPPVGGAANEQLIELLSDYFHIRKSNISILKGESSRLKTVKIEGVEL